MGTMIDGQDLVELSVAWQEFDRLAGLRPIRSDEDYQRTMTLMHRLLDTVGEDEEHPLGGLLNLVSELISQYDQTYCHLPDPPPHELLQYVMEQGEWTADDLRGVVDRAELSGLLDGSLIFTEDVAARLGKFFHLDPALWMARAAPSTRGRA